MRISLVLGTRGRTQEPRRFLTSLAAQTYRDFELVVADQNPDDRLIAILRAFQERFPIVHLRSEPGLSRARNIGLRRVTGQLVGFPDDDCRYPPDLLGRLAAFCRAQPGWDGVLGKLIWNAPPHRCGQTSSFSSSPNPVDIYKATTSVDAPTLLAALRPRTPSRSRPVSSATLFLTRRTLEAVGGFDEQLGIGAGTGWGGGEDVDLVVRCLRSGFKICYIPTLQVYHPDPRGGYGDPERGHLYGAGMGKVLRKHRYPRWFVFYHLLRSLGAAGGALAQARSDKARYFWAVFCGKWSGWHGNRAHG